LQEIFENSLLNLSIENSKQISNNNPHNRANNLHTHHRRDMEALVIMVTNNPNLPRPRNPHRPPEPSQLDRIESRLDSIVELLAVLLDSVRDEAEEQEQADLDGEVIERIKHEQEWL
jgi:diacylglycerol kinase family enzyme